MRPGFPIRKSSNHSSVANSSRLIAGSYVLHRLLMPRHPPCALTNLHRTPRITKRCSRPLYSSQATNRVPTPDSRLTWIIRSRQYQWASALVEKQQAFARSLRTQQRVRPTLHCWPLSRPGRDRDVLTRQFQTDQIIDVPP